MVSKGHGKQKDTSAEVTNFHAFCTKTMDNLLKDQPNAEALLCALEKLGINRHDVATELTRKGRNLVVEFYNASINDAFGDIRGDDGFRMTKRSYVFKHHLFLLILVHAAQIAMCTLILITRVSIGYTLFSVLAVGIYCLAKIFQGYKIIYNATFGPPEKLQKRFLELFPSCSVFSPVIFSYFFMTASLFGVATCVADTKPTISLHGISSIGVSGSIAFCGLVTGVTSNSAIDAISALVAFKFIDEIDDMFVEQMTSECSLETLILSLSPETGRVNYLLYFVGMLGSAVIGALVTLKVFTNFL